MIDNEEEHVVREVCQDGETFREVLDDYDWHLEYLQQKQFLIWHDKNKERLFYSEKIYEPIE
jgi:hypothetical protein